MLVMIDSKEVQSSRSGSHLPAPCALHKQLRHLAMPLLKIFSSQTLRVSANELHPALMAIWKVPADVLKVG